MKSEAYRRTLIMQMKKEKERQIGIRKGIAVTISVLGIIAFMLILGKISANATEKLERKYAGYTYDQCMSEAGNVTEVQKYIVRYGITSEYGLVIETEDGNIWELEDAPEYETETEVRVLFDSNGTIDATDDIIIDITER